MAELFNTFFKEKVEKLSAQVKKDPKNDPFSRLEAKLQDHDLKLNLKTVNENAVMKILKSLKPKKSCGPDGISSEILKLGAEVLVIPLTYIINSSIKTGKYPTNWKTAKVVPLHKTGDKQVLKNYRPLALLPVPGMILERVVAIQIENFFENNRLFGSFQFGFRSKKSTISEMLSLFDNLLEAKETKKEILVILYDLSSAFDTVCHKTLLIKMQMYGLNIHAIRWLSSYLEDRKQMVTVSGKMSSTVTTNIGTPQGSRLSPLLFLCLLADMDCWTQNSMLTNFADDTQSIVISDSIKEAIEITKKEANNIMSFFECNNLVNNADKAAILYNSRGKGKNITIEDMGGETLKSTSSEKLLGLNVDSNGIHILKKLVWS